MLMLMLMWIFDPPDNYTVLVGGPAATPIISDAEVDQALQVAHSHDWIPLATIVVGVLIRLAKSDRAVAWFPVAITPQWRGWAAVVLGLVLGVLHKVALGGGWIAAVIGGVVVGLGAISGHELVVEGLRKGRDIGVAKPAPEESVPATPPPKIISIKPPANVVITNKPTEPPPPGTP